MLKKSSSSFDKPSFLEATKVPAIREVKIAGKSCKVKDIQYEAYSPTNVFTGTAGSNGTLDATLCMPSG